MENKIFKAWKETGILEGLSEEDSISLAEKLNECAEYLAGYSIHVVINEKDNKIETFIFPIIRKIFIRQKNINIRHIFIELSQYYDINFKKFKDKYEKMPRTDFEAEFCVDFVDYFIEARRLLLVKNRLEQNKDEAK